MNKAVVTGGAGFIGSHLTEELESHDSSVTVIDNLSSGKVDNIKSLLSSNKITFIQESITSLNILNQIFSDADYVFHLAALGSVPQSVEQPEAYHEININGIFNISRGETITISNLTDTIIRLSGTDVRPEYREPRPGDIIHSYADITKAKSFGFNSRYAFEEGLSRMIKEYT